MSKIYRVAIYKTVEQDDFEKGCFGEFQDFGEIWSFKSSDLETVISRLKNHLDLTGCEVYENRIETQRTETDDGDAPSEQCLAAWKKGPAALKAFNTKIWCANYTVILETVETTEVCAGILLDKVQS